MTDQQRVIVWVGSGVMVLLLFGNAGFRALAKCALERRTLQHTLADLHQDHDQLTAELKRIQTDPSYTEFLIRQNLGYVKKGEVEYRIMKKGN